MAINHFPVVLPETPGKESKVRSRHRAVIVSGILFLAGAAIVFTVLSVGNREVLIASTTASVVSQSAPAAPSMLIIQPTAGTQASVPTTGDSRTGDEVAGAAKTASENETREVPAEAPFNEFQNWAAEEDARAQAKRAGAAQPPQPIEDALAEDGQSARAVVWRRQESRQIETHHSVKKVRTGHTRARVNNARAEIRPTERRGQARSMQKARLKIQPVHQARLARPFQNTQIEVWPEENAHATWLERTFGWLY